MKGHKAHHHKARERKSKGGKINDYNAKGSPELREADEKEGSFKRGGKAKEYKKGGHVHGAKSKHRLDKKARGGATKGKSPLSSAHAESGPDKGDQGHMGSMPAEVD